LRGIVTAGSGVFSASDNDFFMQDATGGINIFQQSKIDPDVREGDKVEVEGFVDHFTGLTRITSPEISLRAQGVSVPPPLVITTGEIRNQGALYEGSLVRVEEVYITEGSWPAIGSDGTVLIDDGSGECNLFVDEDAGLPAAGAIPDTFEVTGILGQRDTAFPFLSGYRIMPRSGEDIVASHDDGGTSSGRLIASVLPNPVRHHARITFTRYAERFSKLIAFYDVRGRKVGRLEVGPGITGVEWTAEDTSGNPLASGIYFALVKAGGREQALKLVLLR
jgi:hypothetical protein